MKCAIESSGGRLLGNAPGVCETSFSPRDRAQIRILERFLRERPASKVPTEIPSELRGGPVSSQPDQITVSIVAGEFGVSHKHFIEEFRRQVGLTPKLFCIRRFQEELVRIARTRVGGLMSL
jgi:AraC-like DNA-binding protein